jgi:hypothetical protein
MEQLNFLVRRLASESDDIRSGALSNRVNTLSPHSTRSRVPLLRLTPSFNFATLTTAGHLLLSHSIVLIRDHQNTDIANYINAISSLMSSSLAHRIHNRHFLVTVWWDTTKRPMWLFTFPAAPSCIANDVLPDFWMVTAPLNVTGRLQWNRWRLRSIWVYSRVWETGNWIPPPVNRSKIFP